MRNAACQAGSGRPDTGADLAATLAQLRAVLCRPVTSAAAARELAGIAIALAEIGVTLLEYRAALDRNTAARAIADEQVLLGREIERGACWSGQGPSAAPRPLRLVQPG